MGYLLDNLRKLPGWFRSPATTRHYLNRALWESGYPWTLIHPTPLEELFPGIETRAEPIELFHPFQRRRGTTLELEELVVLVATAHHVQARRIVEVGTFDGNTALNLACGVGDGGEVVTIDLPPSAPAAGYSTSAGPVPFERRQYVGHPLESRIRQVYGDSATLDWSALGAPFDLAFIDGDHTSAYVESDTRNALSVLKPGGVVVWHDYEWRPVSRVLDRAVERGERIRWIRGTRLAMGIFKTPSSAARHFQLRA